MQNSRDGESSQGRDAASVPPSGGGVSICVPLEIEKTKAEGVHAEDGGGANLVESNSTWRLIKETLGGLRSEGRGGAATRKREGDAPACRHKKGRRGDGSLFMKRAKDVHLLQEVLLPPVGAFLSVPRWTFRNMLVETEQTNTLRRPSCRTTSRAGNK